MSDLIERDKAIDAIRNHIKDIDGDDDALDYIATNMLKDVPSARPKGEWQMDKDDDIYHCSKCFFEIDASGCIDPTEYISIYNFCPNCGSDNREREGE